MFSVNKVCLAGCLAVLVSPALADYNSIGPNGIRSSVLGLTGDLVAIGQVEVTRPGVLFFDDFYTHIDVAPADVFRQNGPAVMNDAGLHGLQVAGVMIATNGVGIPGVARDALLYSSAYVSEGPLYEDVLKSVQHIASRNGGDVRAINHSYGKELDGLNAPDGNSYLTLGIDWSASAHNVLHVVSGDEGHQMPLPMDNYNGITVGASARDQASVFRLTAQLNTFDYAIDLNRAFNDLIAPGEDIDVAGDNSTIVPDQSGTSLAAPHVTGTLALLQEFADDRIANVGGIRWGNTFGSGSANYTAQRHEVMKAVLLNSADKLGEVHGSQRDIRSHILHGNYTWPDSQAAMSPQIPLDYQFGAGHLNAQRALTQFESGEWDNNSDPVPNIGWDFGETGGAGTIFRYPIAQPLAAGEYIAVTLVWDRFVDKTGDEDTFTPGDLFFATGLSDLDLYVMPSGWVDLGEAPDGFYSVSETENVEHIFAQVPASENHQYEIVIRHFSGGPDQHFGLAWWYGNPYSTSTPGDFDNDGDVDGRDFLEWQRGNSPDPLSAGDLADWQANYGTGSLGAATLVPEPSCLVLLFGLGFLRRR